MGFKTKFGLQREKRTNREGDKREEEKMKRKKESSKGMDSMIFGMDITWKVRILLFFIEF